MEFEHDPNAPDRKQEEVNPLLKLVLELGPLVVFFFANARGAQLADAFPALKALGGPIFIATAAFMVAITAALVASYALTRRLPIMPVVSGAVVLVFGALTLWLHDDLFIKLKPTIVNVLFGSALIGGLMFGKSLLGYVFDSVFKLTEEGWRKLTWRWGLFFFFLAVLNEAIWRTQSTDFWVAFKVWGMMPITLVFTFAQMPLISKYSVAEKE
ncbi:MAG: septation protein A [Rhodobiaceae bacterium]|nr:septation protein A [Rhodobiaceae bacterium]